MIHKENLQTVMKRKGIPPKNALTDLQVLGMKTISVAMIWTLWKITLLNKALKQTLIG